MSSNQSVQEIVFSWLTSYENRFHQQISREIQVLGVPAIGPLVDALREPSLRIAAVELLCEFGTKARNAVSPVLEILGNECDVNLIWPATRLLIAIGRPAIGPLFERIGRANETEFPLIRRALREFSADDVNPGLIKRLRDSDPCVRARCCQILSIVGPSKMHDPTQALIERLTDADESVREAAVETLRISTYDCTILDAFEKGDVASRAACMRVLSEGWNFPSKDSLLFFASALDDSNPIVRIHATNGLLQSAMRVARNVLREECKHELSEVRFTALRACRNNAKHCFDLDDIGFRSRLYDDNQSVAREAVALTVESGQYGRSYARCEWIRLAFEKAILDTNDPKRCRYLYALKRADTFGKSMIPAVIYCLQDPNTAVVTAAIYALGKIGEGCELVVNALIPFLDTSNHRYCDAALDALREIGPAAKQALPQIRNLLNDNNLKNSVLQALESMGPAAEPAMSEVVALIGQRLEHPPFVLASIGTREAIIELARAKASYGNGDRKDFDASCGALALIAESARPVLEAELKTAKPDDVFWILAGLEEVLCRADFHELILAEFLHGSTERQMAALPYLPQIMRNSETLFSQFMHISEVVNRLAIALRSRSRTHRFEALEVFCLIHERWSTITELHRDQLSICLHKTHKEATADYAQYEIESLSRIADKLGFSNY